MSTRLRYLIQRFGKLEQQFGVAIVYPGPDTDEKYQEEKEVKQTVTFFTFIFDVLHLAKFRFLLEIWCKETVNIQNFKGLL